METPKLEQSESITWEHPETRKPVKYMRAVVELGEIGVRLNREARLRPIIEGSTDDGRKFRAFPMNGPDGQPIVEIMEVRPLPDQEPNT